MANRACVRIQCTQHDAPELDIPHRRAARGCSWSERTATPPGTRWIPAANLHPVPEKEYPYDAKARVGALLETLGPIVQRDPEQEIRGIAVPVLEATLEVLKRALPDDPVVVAVVGAYEHEISTGEPVRAVDALLVAKQIDAAIGPYPLTIA